MRTNLILIGFMGTGKTAIGRRLAVHLKKEFYDTDLEVEKTTGLTISQLFQKHGEIRFRSEERLILKQLLKKENCVLATGGGIVLDADNVELMKKRGIIICLMARPEVIYQRVKKRENRPLLQKGDLKQIIKQLLTERQAYYNCADYYLDTSDLDFDEIIEKIVSLINE